MGVLGLLLSSLVIGQGQALELSYPNEPNLAGVEVRWSGHAVPFARHGERWLAVVGVDLDTTPGAHQVDVTFRYGDGHTRVEPQPITVEKKQFPTTKLEVEDRYVELSAEDQARADAEAEETLAIYATLTPEVYWTEPFHAPIAGAVDGRNFGHRRVFNGQARNPHAGADLRAKTGTPVYAANRGRVVLAKELFYSGNAVFIDHGEGLYSSYLHLSEIKVAPGTMVERGALLGLSGATGRVTGPHLHWGVRIIDARVDPFSLLKLATE